jgi:hypothetical protein
MEADVFPLHAPERADEIDGAIGDGSLFHATFGFYAHGVGPETAVAPAGWLDRLVPVEAPPGLPRASVRVGWCIEPYDLILAKLAAGRDRDMEFAEAVVRGGLVAAATLRARLLSMPSSHRDLVAGRLAAVLATAGE